MNRKDVFKERRAHERTETWKKCDVHNLSYLERSRCPKCEKDVYKHIHRGNYMKVNIQLDETSQPIKYDNVRNTYTKGDLFCVYVDSGEVHKFPISSIFRIVETFGWHGDGSIEESKQLEDLEVVYSRAGKPSDTPYAKEGRPLGKPAAIISKAMAKPSPHSMGYGVSANSPLYKKETTVDEACNSIGIKKEDLIDETEKVV
jgi:hypothetical protein